MHDYRPLLQSRVRRHLDDRIRPAAHTVVAPLDLAAYLVTDEGGVPGQGEPVAREIALAAEYEPFAWPGAWGPGWGTTWFRATCDVPEEVRGAHLELVLDISGQRCDDGPGFQAEAMVYRPDGSIVKAINPRNRWVPVEAGTKRVEVYLEAASNPPMEEGKAFAPTLRGEKSTVGPHPQFAIAFACLVMVHDEVVELIADLDCLIGLAGELPEDSSRRWDIEVAMDRAMDELDLADIPGTAAVARAQLADVLSRPAHASEHKVSAIGHAHIDTAWLWPIRETRRKIGRTIANVLGQIESGSELQFALPAAQHIAWLEQDYPDLFARLQQAVADGRVHPVGSQWVEPDAVLPGGEAMCRQFTYGVRTFRDKLGVRTRGVWLPDSFGYSAALPQLAVLSGAEWFLTQKISWNQRNKFPHHTFWWEGIDGTRVFTHFPPCDTYNAEISGRELGHSVKNFQDKGHAHRSLMPFGWGDGGGGPTREMVAQARRTANLEGSPTVTIESPDTFFDKAKADYPDAPTWVGELYLELHRGTFTSQARTKAGNRRNEHLLKMAEAFCATAAARGLMEYPYDELDTIWQQVLTGQFHDILPGSSIAWAHRENAQMHERLSVRLREIVAEAVAALVGEGSDELVVSANPMGSAPFAAEAVATGGEPARVESDGNGWVLSNGVLTVKVDENGLVTSLVDAVSGREAVPTGAVGNLLQLHQDFPNAWDAWDIDSFYRHRATDLVEHETIRAEEIDGVATVTVERAFGRSRVTQQLLLRPGSGSLESRVHVDWHEHEKLLKLAWPFDVHTDEARFETQFGHVRRPIHTNTSWDDARFEVNAHRWVHVGEPGYGVAIANERTYGWDVTRRADQGRHSYVVVRASVIRGPRYPDPMTDQGEHDVGFLITPNADVLTAVRTGYEANLPPVLASGSAFEPLVRVSGGAVLETVKLADDRSGDIVCRLYEPRGARAKATLTTSFQIAEAVETDLCELPLGVETHIEPTAITGGVGEREVPLGLRPFQVATIRLRCPES